MKRRSFIRTITAGFAAAFMPWKGAKALPAAVATHPVTKAAVPIALHQTAVEPFARMAFPLLRRCNYGELSRNLIKVQPLPERTDGSLR